MLGSDFKITYAPKDEAMISNLASQLYRDELDNISDIENNSVTFKTMYIFQQQDQIEVKVFIINSTHKNVNFDYLPLGIVNENDELIASEDIRAFEIGEIPPMNARPYSVFFSRKSLIGDRTVNDKCKLVIQPERTVEKESNRIPVGYVDDAISLYDKKIIEKYIENMPPVVKDDSILLPFKNGIEEDGTKYSVFIVVNGSNKEIQVKDITVIYKNPVGEIQASKKIHLVPSVLPNSISVYKVILQNEDIYKESFDPEDCKITFM